MRRLFVAGFFSLALLWTNAAFAEGKRFGPAFIQRFELTESQVKGLERLKTFRESSRNEERTIRHEINSILYAETLDNDELRGAIEKLSSFTGSNMTKDAELTREFYLSLNERQRQLWLSHETREERNRRAFGGGKGQGGGRAAETPER